MMHIGKWSQPPISSSSTDQTHRSLQFSPIAVMSGEAAVSRGSVVSSWGLGVIEDVEVVGACPFESEESTVVFGLDAIPYWVVRVEVPEDQVV